MTTSLTSQLSAMISAKPSSQADLEAASLFVLDTLACALAARYSPQAQAMKQFATHRGMDANLSAFVFAGLAHIVEMDDLHRASVTHPGTVVVPAALALALNLDKDGPAMLRAVLEGYEACCRIGAAVGPAHYRLWHNTATCGPFGAAQVGASLLGLNHQQQVWALGNAGTQAAGVWQFLDDGAMSKHLHTARAAEAGMTAAHLAQHGFTGPAHILEGARGFFAAMCPDARPQAVLANSDDSPWQLQLTSMKPYPCCRHTHPAIDVAIELHRQLREQGLDPASIDFVVVDTYAAALDVCNRPKPETAYQAKFSLQYTVAAALTHGRIEFDSFDAEARAACKTRALTVQLRQDETFQQAYPEAWGARLYIAGPWGMRQGETQQALGDPAKPLDRDAVIAKAKALMDLGEIPLAQAEALIEACLALPQPGARLPRPFRLLMEGSAHEHA